MKLDATLNLDVICQSKVKDAVEAVATQAGSVVTVTQTRTSLSVSTTTSVWTTTKVTFSGLMSCAGTTVTAAAPTATVTSTVSAGGRGVVVNAAAVVASSTVSSVATPSGCLKDAEATAIVDAFKGMFSSGDKSAVQKVAEGLLADEFMGMSTGVNSLGGGDVSHLFIAALHQVSFHPLPVLVPVLTMR